MVSTFQTLRSILSDGERCVRPTCIKAVSLHTPAERVACLQSKSEDVRVNTKFVAQIVRSEDGEVVYESKSTDRRGADQIADGMGINLNWEEYTTRVVER